LKIHKLTHKKTKMPIFMEILAKIFTNCFFTGFQRIKRVEALKQTNNQVFTEFE
jgi:hypothetical protein